MPFDAAHPGPATATTKPADPDAVMRAELKATLFATKSASLLAAESQLTAARGRRAGIAEALRQNIRNQDAPFAEGATAQREVRRLDVLLASADAETDKARMRLSEERAKIADMVARAAAPYRLAAARRLAAALVEVEKAEATLELIVDFASRNGLPAPFSQIRRVSAEDVLAQCDKVIAGAGARS